jgi:hypothetical protein
MRCNLLAFHPLTANTVQTPFRQCLLDVTSATKLGACRQLPASSTCCNTTSKLYIFVLQKHLLCV